jgi:hypothetical protein
MPPLLVVIDTGAEVEAIAMQAMVAIVMAVGRVIATPAKIAMEAGDRRQLLGECLDRPRKWRGLTYFKQVCGRWGGILPALKV